jgi:DNA (cytosine-5)-methyltransferase 1
MPKAAINKHNESLTSKYKIRPTDKWHVSPPAGDSVAPQKLREQLLGSGVAPSPNTRHDPRPLGSRLNCFCKSLEPIHHEDYLVMKAADSRYTLQSEDLERNMGQKKKLRAIDLYSGVGGWSLGLKLAGIDVVASYEWWRPAIYSNELNNRHEGFQDDIRARPLNEFRKDVDIVVGSPPCTEFSFSNRGGKGDIEDGLRDIRKFLEVVEYVRPVYWIMENVPRVAQILAKELGPGGSLHRFARLSPEIHVVDMAEFGLPQSRSRCIAGNIDFRLLFSYRSRCPKRTLRSVITALSKRTMVTDPIYGIRCKSVDVIDHKLEPPLSPEEQRMNKEAKTYHPVYNNMSFPDRMDRPVRTITATCTRVSRESVIVETQPGHYRRLTVRERATLQGFPISFQFYGETYQQKLKMIGNAIPPLFTFYIGQAMKQVPVSRLKQPAVAIKAFTAPIEIPTDTPPDRIGRLYPPNRRFRMALPHLRFKSGVRFELANDTTEGVTQWSVKFYFGTSRNIHELKPDSDTTSLAVERVRDAWPKVDVDLIWHRISETMQRVDPELLQRTWARAATNSEMHPFELVDFLGNEVSQLLAVLKLKPVSCKEIVEYSLERWARSIPPGTEVQGIRKVLDHSPAVLSGFVVGHFANEALASRGLSTTPRSSSRRIRIAA